MVVEGGGFSDPMQVFFSDAKSDDVQFISVDSLSVVTPPEAAGIPGPVDVRVVRADGRTANLAQGFLYQPLQLKLKRVDPDTGLATGGELVLLEGERFDDGLRVFFGIEEALDVTVLAPDTAAVLTPPNRDELHVIVLSNNVSVIDTDNNEVIATVEVGDTPVGFGLFIVPPAQLVIDRVNPDRGTVAGGTKVVVEGGGFSDPMQVFFSDAKSDDVQFISVDSLSVVTPPEAAGIPGPVDVRVVRADGRTANLAQGFLYQPLQLKLKRVDPDTGLATGGELVLLEGERFDDGLRVFFGIEEALDVTVLAPDTAAVLTPPNKVGKVDVQVRDTLGQRVNLRDGFEYLLPDPPVIESLNPPSGDINGDEPVTIIGRNFKPPLT